ncbi:MAG: cytochrome c [Vicinamibacterales bacterium]
MSPPKLAVAAIVVTTLGAVAAVMTRGMGFTSRAQPSTFEERIMRGARSWAVPSEVRRATNPAEDTPAVIRDAMAHWADHCASCHGNDGAGQTTLGRNLYPPAPDMRTSRTQNMSDGELFYVVERGIPLTGMPAWGNGTAEGVRQSWELVRFIRHLPRLTPAELTQMEQLNPRSPAQEQQEKQIDDFLSGHSH